MPTTKKTATRRPSHPAARKSRTAASQGGDVTVRLSYTEASLLVVGASLATGFADRPGAGDEDRAMAALASGIVDKLYQAEPALKHDARRVEGEMRSFVAELSEADSAFEDFDDDMDEPEDDPALKGEGWLEMIVDAVEESQELALQVMGDDGRECHLHPLGAGQIGGVAVAIGWSQDARDFTAVRLDKVDAVRATGREFANTGGGLTEACLERFGRPSRRDPS